MPTSSTRYRLKELHGLLISEFDRNARDNAMAILLAIAKEARAARITEDPEIPTVSGKVRAGYWRTLYETVRTNPPLALEVFRNWTLDKEAA